MLGGVLTLLAAAIFAFSNVSTRRAVITGRAVQGLFISIPIGVPLFLAAALLTGTFGAVTEFTLRATLNLSLAGIAHFVIGRYCNYRGIRALGANLAAPIQQASLLFALVFAIWLLDEVLTPLRFIGIALVLLAPAIMLRRRKPDAPGRGAATRFQPQYAEGYTFALLSAAAYGTSPIFVRAALVDAGPGASLAAGLISYVAAMLIIAPALLHPLARRNVRALERGNAKWFVIGGTATSVSQMLRYTALSLAPVTVVSSIMRMDMVFRYFFSWIINPEHEVFGLRIIGAMAVSLLGAMALTLSTDFVLSAVPLPDYLIDAARWQWP